jgi:hypothetical protein
MGEPLWVVVNSGEDDEAVVQVSMATRIRLVTEQGDGGSAIVATFRDQVDVELVSGLPLKRASTLLKILQINLAAGGPPMSEFVRGRKTGTVYLREQDSEKLDRLAETEDDAFDREDSEEDLLPESDLSPESDDDEDSVDEEVMNVLFADGDAWIAQELKKEKTKPSSTARSRRGKSKKERGRKSRKKKDP